MTPQPDRNRHSGEEKNRRLLVRCRWGWLAVLFLIDGYNLMHAAGVVGRVRAGPLKSARLRLLDWLAGAVRGRGDTLRVLFDGQAAPAESGEETYRGVQVKFAYRATADDEHSRPRTTSPTRRPLLAILSLERPTGKDANRDCCMGDLALTFFAVPR